MDEDEREERRQMLRERRKWDKLIQESSLSDESLWVVCSVHGRQARDPYTEECILCGTKV